MLLKIDLQFLQSAQIQQQLRNWRTAAHYDRTAKDKLRKVGSALIPNTADGRRSLLRDIGPEAYKVHQADAKRFIEIVDSMPNHEKETAAAELIALSKKWHEINRPGTKKAERRGPFLESLPDKGLEADQLSPTFRDYRPEWAYRNPGDIAMEIIAQAIESAEGRKLGLESVRKSLQRGKEDQGTSKKRPKRKRKTPS